MGTVALYTNNTGIEVFTHKKQTKSTARPPCVLFRRVSLTHNNMDALTHRPISPNPLFPSNHRAGIFGRVMGGENRFLNLQFFHMEPMHPEINSTTELIYLKESIPLNRFLGPLIFYVPETHIMYSTLYAAVDFLNVLKKYIMYLEVMVGEKVHNVFHYVPITPPPPPPPPP